MLTQFRLIIGACFALIGGALQAATQSSDFILVARVVTGMGTGALTGITPVLVSETSSAGQRGGYLGYVFIANCKYSRHDSMHTQVLTAVRLGNFCGLLAFLWTVFRRQR